MKQLTRITLILLATLLFVSVSSAKWQDEQFGLSDSCWQVFLSQLAGDDSSLSDHFATADMLDEQIDSMMKLLPGLRGKAVKELQLKIHALRKQRIALHKEVNRILLANMALLMSVRQTCIEDTTVTDTTDTTGGGNDTTGGGNDTTGTDSLTIGLNPNPLTIGGSVNLTFTLTAPANVTVNIYNQTTATLVQSFSYPGLVAGPQTLLLDLAALPSGSYIVQVQVGTSVGTATLLIL